MSPNLVTDAELANTLAIKWCRRSIWWLGWVRWVPDLNDLRVLHQGWLDTFTGRKSQLGYKTRPRNARERVVAPAPAPTTGEPLPGLE